jgi:hypothetical protein
MSAKSVENDPNQKVAGLNDPDLRCYDAPILRLGGAQ